MVTIKFKNLADVPAFVNFRDSVLEEFDALSVPDTLINKVSHRVEFLNEKLKEFNAVYTWRGDLPQLGQCGRTLEFASEEDYAYFILKWS